MGKIDRQHKNIKKAGTRLDLEFAQTAHGLEDQLKTMGIVIPRTAPRIPAPYHTRGEDARRVKDPRSNNHSLHQNHKTR